MVNKPMKLKNWTNTIFTAHFAHKRFDGDNSRTLDPFHVNSVSLSSWDQHASFGTHEGG